MADAIAVSKNMYRAFRLTADVSDEVNAVRNEIDKAYVHLGHRELKVSAGEEIDDRWSQEEWICLSWHIRHNVKQGRRLLGHIGYVYDFGMPASVAGCIEQAVAIVAWSSNEHTTWRIDHFRLPNRDTWPKSKNDEGGTLELKSGTKHLVLCKVNGIESSSISEMSCWYAIPLGALRQRADIKRLLIEPIVALIAGDSIKSAFAKVRPEELVQLDITGGELRAATRAR